MKKFILPAINLIALVLSAVVFGLGANSAVYLKTAANGAGNWYQLVWTVAPGTVIPLVGFFAFCVAVFLTLVFMFIPLRISRFGVLISGLLFAATGAMFLLSKDAVYSAHKELYHMTDSFIAMAVLVFVAGGLELIGSVVEFLPEKK